MEKDLTEVIENEWYIVRHSGETPEIAYHSAIYYLGRAQDGPHITLSEGQIEELRKAAVDRYAEIVLRDLQHANAAKSIYRGIGRSIINYKRFCIFCSRQQIEVDRVRSQAAEALLIFLDTEIEMLQSCKRPSIINCTYVEIEGFAALLGIELGRKYIALERYCPPPT